MGIIDFSERVARNAWRIPVVGSVLTADDARSFAKMPPNRFRGVHASFAEAEAAIPKGHRIGYDHDALAGMYRNRIQKACQSDYAILFWLRDLLNDQTRLFDFGGHIGVSYYGWKNYLTYPPGMRWLICDMPAIIREGQSFAQEQGADSLFFTDELASGSDTTIFMAAGSLQYVDMSVTDILTKMGARPQHLLINKMPLYDGETFVTVQSTGRAFHPYRISNRDEFVSGITALGYRVVDDWTNRETSCRIPHTRGRDIDAYSGYYFIRED